MTAIRYLQVWRQTSDSMDVDRLLDAVRRITAAQWYDEVDGLATSERQIAIGFGPRWLSLCDSGFEGLGFEPSALASELSQALATPVAEVERDSERGAVALHVAGRVTRRVEFPPTGPSPNRGAGDATAEPARVATVTAAGDIEGALEEASRRADGRLEGWLAAIAETLGWNEPVLEWSAGHGPGKRSESNEVQWLHFVYRDLVPETAAGPARFRVRSRRMNLDPGTDSLLSLVVQFENLGGATRGVEVHVSGDALPDRLELSSSVGIGVGVGTAARQLSLEADGDHYKASWPSLPVAAGVAQADANSLRVSASTAGRDARAAATVHVSVKGRLLDARDGRLCVSLLPTDNPAGQDTSTLALSMFAGVAK